MRYYENNWFYISLLFILFSAFLVLIIFLLTTEEECYTEEKIIKVVMNHTLNDKEIDVGDEILVLCEDGIVTYVLDSLGRIQFHIDEEDIGKVCLIQTRKEVCI